MAVSAEQLQCLITEFRKVYEIRKLKVNAAKSKVIVTEREKAAPQVEV